MEREVLRAGLAPGPGCLSMEQLGRYADGALDAAAQLAAADHVRGCLNCRAELALRQEVMSGGPRPGEADVVREGVARLEARAPEIFGAGRRPATPASRRWLGLGRPPFAVAAALLVAAGGLYLGVGRAPELPPTVTSEGEITRSLALRVRAPVGDQAEVPKGLEWRAVDGAVRYRARLREVDGREVWSTSTTGVEAELPAAVRASLAPGRTLLWDVTAYDAADAAIAESGAQSFRLLLK